MIKKILKRSLNRAAEIFGWQIVFLPKNSTARTTAVKSDLGFWYAGNVFDSSDIAYGVFRNGLVEEMETNLVVRVLNTISEAVNGLHFYDIGANSGYYGILAAFLGKDKTKTFSFEPLKEYVNLIKDSVDINHLENSVKVFTTALGASESSGVIQISGSGSSLVPGFLGKDNPCPTREITIQKLDDIVKTQNLPLPHFIKIDVEGFELAVLRGSESTIKQAKPVLFIEVANTLITTHGKFVNTEARVVFDLLAGLGYNAFIVKETIEAINTVSNDTGVYMYLFLNNENPLHEKIKQSL